MTALDFLKSLKKYIESEICSKHLLQAENGKEYVVPNCYIMHLPNENFNPKGFTVPFYAIELDAATEDVNENSLDIRITIATYGGGYYLDASENQTDIPDGNGYIDLLNAIEITKQALLKNATMNGMGTIEKPISYGTYDVDAPFPYWYGYLKFKVEIPSNDYIIDLEREGIL